MQAKYCFPHSVTISYGFSGSPTPSDSSSQNAAINTQALTAAAMKREETAKLTASLSNYYNEKLIGHVLGWQADIVEKQVLVLRIIFIQIDQNIEA